MGIREHTYCCFTYMDFLTPRIRCYRNHKHSKEHKTSENKRGFKYDNTHGIITSELLKFLLWTRQAEF